jgi:hypothetical protein
MLNEKEKLQIISAMSMFLQDHSDILSHTTVEGEAIIARANEVYGFDVINCTVEQDKMIIGEMYELVRRLTAEVLEGEGEA